MIQQVFITSDGKKFTTLEEANAYESTVELYGQFRDYLKKSGVTRVSRPMLEMLHGWEIYKLDPAAYQPTTKVVEDAQMERPV